ncbi:glutamine amidotransferase, class I [delta proteobacterium NaphS2]|nr:glutamine amidotransferase, class I [delta proteobacterium NaphS2]
MHSSGRLVVIDNYDSFTYNLVQMFMTFGLDIQVYRSDVVSVGQVLALAPDFILISPGPKDPQAAGISMELILECHQIIPILGVCLGMQCINAVFGGQTVRCHQPVHGKTDRIRHNEQGIFKGLPSPFTAARYHSLRVRPTDAALTDELMITACTEDNLIMGLSHRHYPLHGVQFHPESFLTEHGFDLVENFLKSGKTPIDHRPALKHLGINPLEFPSSEACDREMHNGF